MDDSFKKLCPLNTTLLVAINGAVIQVKKDFNFFQGKG